jgi:argininosuccinate lyase
MARRSVWPGYTHTRRAMPSSAALWAAGLAEGLLNTLSGLPALWSLVDRSPLGSAAGYGVPLPLKREVTARALGFAGVDQVVTAVQSGRGQIEAGAVFWCVELGLHLGRLAGDAILLSGDELGYLELPGAFTTGSSIMPHKRNPDVLELTRGRAALLQGDLTAVLSLRTGLSSGYHRDYQLLKEPLIRALDRTLGMLEMIGTIIPGLTVNRRRAREAVSGDVLATDEVMRRVEQGDTFRSAYRAVKADIKDGGRFPEPSIQALLARRQSTGGLGNLGLPVLATRQRQQSRWEARERRRFMNAMRRLSGRHAR